MKVPVECSGESEILPARKAHHVRLCVALFSTSAPVWYRSLIKLDALPEKALMHKEGAAGFSERNVVLHKASPAPMAPHWGQFPFFLHHLQIYFECDQWILHSCDW